MKLGVESLEVIYVEMSATNPLQLEAVCTRLLTRSPFSSIWELFSSKGFPCNHITSVSISIESQTGFTNPMLLLGKGDLLEIINNTVNSLYGKLVTVCKGIPTESLGRHV